MKTKDMKIEELVENQIRGADLDRWEVFYIPMHREWWREYYSDVPEDTINNLHERMTDED